MEIDAGKQQRFQGNLPKERLNTIMGGSAGQQRTKHSVSSSEGAGYRVCSMDRRSRTDV
jgi:hypothetical protein